MEKKEYRAVIKFFVLKGLSATEIHNELLEVLKESAPSFPTVHRWTLEFKRGRTSVQDDPREGRPKSATTEENIQQVKSLIEADSELTEDELAKAVGISHGSIHHILCNVLGIKRTEKINGSRKRKKLLIAEESNNPEDNN